MANVKVSELPAASAASTSQEFEVNDSGTSKKVTGSQIKSFVKADLVSTDIDGVTSSIQDQLNDKFKQRTITGTADQITVTNGDGVTGNPTIAAVIASQAEAQSGTDTTKLMTPQRMRNALNATGSAPVYACRAWVNFNGTGTVAIRGSGNVSSITDNGVGKYSVNFITGMQDTNFSICGASNTNTAAAGFRTSVVAEAEDIARTVGKASIWVGWSGSNTTLGAARDETFISVNIFR